MKALTDFMSRLVKNYLPDAFLIALFLTLLTLILGIITTEHGPLEMIGFWGNGFWVFLAFAMQMALVLITGIVLANTPLVSKFLSAVGAIAKTPTQAYIMTFLVSAIAYYINWGLAVVVGALFAREMARRLKNVDFPFLIASAYSATVIWHVGLSGSIPLAVATEGHIVENLMGIVPTSQTIFAAPNLIILIVLVITIPIVLALMSPKERINELAADHFPEDTDDKSANIDKKEMTPAQRWENSPIITVLAALVGLTYVVLHFAGGNGLDLNIINLLFLSAGILMHKTPAKFIAAAKDATSVVSPIIIQFPLYAGITAMLASSGMGSAIAAWFASISSGNFNYVLTYWSAGLLNIFAPSGGGQWGLQGPIQLEAAINLGLNPARTAMSVAWGDAWTNLIQPFWALPILAIAKLGIRDIMGYCIVLGVWVGLITSILMFILY